MGASTPLRMRLWSKGEAMSALPVKPRPIARRRASRWTQPTRYVVQFGFAAFIGWIFINHAISDASGPLAPAAPESYCPLGGFESLYKYLTSGGQFVAHVHLSNMVLAISVVATAVVAKGFFCGWVCPLGAIQQLLTGIRRWLQRRWRPLNSFARWLGVRSRPLAFLDRWLRWGKYLVLIWIIWGTAYYGVMVFRDVDPWAALLNVLEEGKGLGFVVLIATLVAALVGDRVFCRYACPLGAIVGIFGKISLIKVQREASACIGCGLCSKKCPMNIPVDEKSRVAASECNLCLNCVDACPVPGALELRAVIPGIQRQAASTEVV